MEKKSVLLPIGLLSVAAIAILLSCGGGGSDREELLVTYYVDVDGDGYGDPAHSKMYSTPQAGWVLNNTDCDDTNADIHPGAMESCNDGVDNNCNARVDCYDDESCAGSEHCSNCTDADDDGYFAIDVLCSGSNDCDDSNAQVNPGGAGAFGCPASCSSCTDDEDCGVGNRCIVLDGENVCANRCLDFDLCPAGYVCQTQAEGERLCIPASNSCGCLAKDEGKERICWTSNTFGTCYGQERCDPNAGWMDCSAQTPEAEVCDGLDNDCDGEIDEDFPTLGDACYAGQGECRRSGTMVCDAAGTGVTCDAIPGAPQAEVCDGRDNDCDGIVDNNLVYPLCEKQEGVCAGARKGAHLCGGEAGWLPCETADYAGSSEVCDGLDNDCDGEIDEDFPTLGDACYAGQGECRRSGTMVCDAAGTGAICDAIPDAPQAEVCDGLDNDCDGVVDEGCT